ncbi:MAG: 4-hydroxythreonine-4-phosphate dehydrogenase PdxA [Chloroflexota bacterium]
MNREARPIVAVTMGDAAGTGPEIITKAFAGREIQDIARAVVIGDLATMQAALEITKAALKVRGIRTLEEARFQDGALDVIDLQNIDLSRLERGRIDAMAGRAAFAYIKQATELALSGKVNAIVTSAISKEALNRAGYQYPGHTELLAELCGVSDIAMMLVSGRLRVIHVTTHVSLRQVAERLSPKRILTVIGIADDAVRRMGVVTPHIAVAGLNPHAGEGGLFGDEEERIIVPAVAASRRQGFSVTGPLPPDSVFFRAAQGEFDAVVAMYHDQGHIAIKMLGIDEGVNITLGLPIIRTSVDHGTAFDKAGKGTASPKSLVASIKLASLLWEHRKPAGKATG